MPTDGIPAADRWFWYVLGKAVEEIIFRVTSGVVADGRSIAATHAATLGHTVMVSATRCDADSRAEIEPVVQLARQAYAGPRGKLDRATVRPVRLANGRLQLGGSTTTAPRDVDAALAFWELGRPVDDIVALALPQVPPDMSTTAKVYEFIGGVINDAVISARAARLCSAARLLLGKPAAATD